jgi:hypothetical protein
VTGPTPEDGSRVEAAVALVHHAHHHPADPNVGVLRARLDRTAVVAAVVAAALTVAGVILLGLAIGGSH